MTKSFNFLKQSNRYKHLVGGFLVGLFAPGALPALYSAVVAASCLELKDKLSGSWWDWVDWAVTVAGGAVAAALWLL